MKYNVKDYAIALADVMLGPKISDKKIADNFFKVLEKNRQLKNAKKIVELAQKYYLEKKGNKSVLLETARKTDVKSVLKSILKNGDAVEEKINPELIAGIKVIINNEKQLDFSLHKKLQEIFK